MLFKYREAFSLRDEIDVREEDKGFIDKEMK